MLYHPVYTNYYINDACEIFGPRSKINPTIHHTGYQVFSVTKGKQIRAHRFIYECFNGILEEGLQINHIDGNKKNNFIDNLEAVTAKENVIHAHKLGLRKGLAGEDNGNAKLSHKGALLLLKDISLGMANTELGIKYNLHPRYVSLVRHKHRWKSLWQEFEGSETISKESRAK